MLRVLGLLLASMGLVGQLSFGSLTPATDAAESEIAALAAASIDCHASPPSAPGNHAPHRHHQPDPSLCPLRPAIELPGYTLLPPIAMPTAATSTLVRSGMPPPARGPPQATARVGEPRAPPIQA